jgi:hypothetical protein
MAKQKQMPVENKAIDEERKVHDQQERQRLLFNYRSPNPLKIGVY